MGTIIPHLSQPGTYTVTYTIPTTAQNCTVAAVATTVVITDIPTATIQYPQIVYCQSELPQNVQLSGTGLFVGGNFTANPNGLSIDENTGMIAPTLSAPGNYTIVYTIPESGGCAAIPATTHVTINPLPNPQISDGAICVDATGHVFRTYWLDTQMGDADCSYEWFQDGIRLAENSSAHEATSVGTYAVVATNNVTGCQSEPVFATVGGVATPNNFITSLSDTFTENATLTLVVEGGTGPYLFSIDGGAFEYDSVYTNLPPGTHTIAVTDANGCTNLTKEILILDFPKFFTPNNDGYNDSWNIFRLRDQPDAQIFIYDRYGKLLKQINPTGAGWDGSYNGRAMPSEDYWFTVDFREMDLKGVLVQKRFRSHFSMKR